MNIEPLGLYQPQLSSNTEKSHVLEHSTKVTPIKGFSSTLNILEEMNQGKKISDLFILKSFIGFDIAMKYLAGLEYFDEVTLEQFLDMLQNQIFSSAEIKTELISSNDIFTPLLSFSQTHYLNFFVDQELILSLLYKFYLEFSQAFQNEKIMDLFRAEAESSDALDSFLDNMVASKGPLSKDRCMYEQGLEEIMGYFFEKIFNIYNVLELEPLFERHNCVLICSQKYKSNWVCSNIIDLIIYDHLLNDDFPLGYIKFSLVLQDISDIKVCLKLDFYKGHKSFINYEIIYNFKENRIFLKSNLKTKDIIRVIVNKDGMSGMHGTLNRREITIKILKTKSEFEELLELYPWKSNRVLNHHHIEDGNFVNSKSMKQKHLNVQYQVRENGKRHFVFKKVNLGEDHYVGSYIFRDDIPIPLNGCGVIKNKEALKQPATNNFFLTASTENIKNKVEKK